MMRMICGWMASEQQPARSQVFGLLSVVAVCGLSLPAWQVVAAEKNEAGCKSEVSGTPSSAITDADIIKFIDEQIRKGWTDAEISPSPVATENEWCRRVFLDVLGRVPRVDELQRF